jgi:rRNA maturation endonuclease Nob1
MDNIEESSIKEAIDVLSDFSKQVTAKADGAYEKARFIEAKKLAIFALKKKIAKKPKKMTHPLLKVDGWEYECLACGCAVGENKNAEDYTQKDDYCPSCGQKLNWNN